MTTEIHVYFFEHNCIHGPPPFEKGGHIALHLSVGMSVGRYVGRSVCRYVGRSVSLNLVQLITQ